MIRLRSNALLSATLAVGLLYVLAGCDLRKGEVGTSTSVVLKFSKHGGCQMKIDAEPTYTITRIGRLGEEGFSVTATRTRNNTTEELNVFVDWRNYAAVAFIKSSSKVSIRITFEGKVEPILFTHIGAGRDHGTFYKRLGDRS